MGDHAIKHSEAVAGMELGLAEGVPASMWKYSCSATGPGASYQPRGPALLPLVREKR
jgi:hypothetical protein